MSEDKKELIYGLIFSIIVSLILCIVIYIMTGANYWNVGQHDQYCEGIDCKCHERGI